MGFKQCKFKDLENDTILGGFYNEEENYILCGCCGGIIDLNEEPSDYEILEIYKYWVDLTEFIIDEVEPINIAREILSDVPNALLED